jgi:hypothetical protein
VLQTVLFKSVYSFIVVSQLFRSLRFLTVNWFFLREKKKKITKFFKNNPISFSFIHSFNSFTSIFKQMHKRI